MTICHRFSCLENMFGPQIRPTVLTTVEPGDSEPYPCVGCGYNRESRLLHDAHMFEDSLRLV